MKSGDKELMRGDTLCETESRTGDGLVIVREVFGLALGREQSWDNLLQPLQHLESQTRVYSPLTPSVCNVTREGISTSPSPLLRKHFSIESDVDVTVPLAIETSEVGLDRRLVVETNSRQVEGCTFIGNVSSDDHSHVRCTHGFPLLLTTIDHFHLLFPSQQILH